MYSGDSYNKGTRKGHGTLISNWWEEETLRDFTGEGRTIPKTHVAKKHGDFDTKINAPTGDNSTKRIHGTANDQLFQTEQRSFGSHDPKQDYTPGEGRRAQMMRKMVQQEVNMEMEEKEREEEAQRNSRYFETTNGETFTKQNLKYNTVGRRVMKDRDGRPLTNDNRDENLMVEFGMGRRGATKTDAELLREIPQSDVYSSNPVSLYTQRLNKKGFYMSAATGNNPFGKSTGFTQTVHHTKAVVGFEGNVNLGKDRDNTVHRQANPSLIRRDFGATNAPQIDAEGLRKRVIHVCKRRGVDGLRGLRRMFKIMDDNGNGYLSRSEMKYGLKDYGLALSDDEVDAVMDVFDRNQDGKISFDEFIVGIRGDINERRKQLILLAYGVLDKTGDGIVDIEDIRIAYDASYHPDVIAGKKTKDDVFREFMDQWDTKEKDGKVTQEEFIEYYKDVSASIDKDDYFELMIRNAWHIPGGEGWCENTANQRVLVTDKDGSQRVEMIEDDLGKRGTYGKAAHGRIDLQRN